MAPRYGVSSTKGPGVMRIFIEPTEPLLFRTGRSFDAGESNFAESTFPPTPETMQGALRAMIATHSTHVDRRMSLAARFETETLIDLIGNYQMGYGRFRITGFTVGRINNDNTIERLFPAPAHLIQVRFKESEKPTVVRLKPRSLTGATTNMPEDMHYLIAPDLEGKVIEGKPKSPGWLTESDLKIALQAREDLSQIKPVSNGDIYKQESRLGIGMDNRTKITQEGFLYQIQMIRMERNHEYIYGFVVDIRLARKGDQQEFTDDSQTQKELGLPSSGWLTLGGEQRAAHFTVLETEITDQYNNVEQSKLGRFVYLATPAHFTDGWRPPANRFDSSNKLRAAAINRAESIGGWELNPHHAGGKGKTTRRCIPAGSVYFFDKPVSVTQPLTEYGWQIGYGIAYTGDYES
jgi:CRISPR-associated protein Cmr3